MLQLCITETFHRNLDDKQLEDCPSQHGQDQLRELQCQFEEAIAENSDLEAQLKSERVEIERLGASLTEAERQLADSRLTLQEMDECNAESSLTSCEQDLLLQQCLTVATVQQELDLQVHFEISNSLHVTKKEKPEGKCQDALVNLLMLTLAW